MAAADSMGISSPLLGSPFRQKYPPLYGQDIDIDRILEKGWVGDQGSALFPPVHNLITPDVQFGVSFGC